MKLIVALALSAVVMVLPACRETTSGLVVGTGTVHPSFAECRGWFIHADAGREYELTSLATEFKHSDLRVRFTLKERNDLASICMLDASKADVVSIRKL